MSKPPEVRAATDDDQSAMQQVMAAAYGGQRMPHLLDALHEDPVAWLDLAFVAEDRNGVVAACAYTRGWLDSPTRLVGELVLTPLAGPPDRQRAGVGTHLVKESLRQVGERAEPLVFLEGDPGFF